MNKESINKKIEEIFTQRKDIVSLGYGKKTKNGQYTGEMGFIFGVEEKRPLSELKPEEIIPNHIQIGGENIITDVIENKGVSALDCTGEESNCYQWQQSNFPMPMRGNIRPIVGGIQINAQNVFGVGTLGLVVVDSATQALVGLTNHHVIVGDAHYTHYRDLYSFFENERNSGVGQPFLNVGDEIGIVMKYCPIHPLYSNVMNKIDAAIVALKSNVVSFSQSYKVYGLTGYTSPMQFASTSEINSIDDLNIPLISVGRTTGIKEGSPCGLEVYENPVAIRVRYNLQGAQVISRYVECISFRRRNFNETDNACLYPVWKGDSGSILIGNFGGVYKIVGLVFAVSDDLKEGFACRIDNVVSELGIEAWDGTPKNFINIDAVQTRSVQGTSLDKTITCGGQTFWQVGLSNYNNPC